jgi:hypothetical protein
MPLNYALRAFARVTYALRAFARVTYALRAFAPGPRAFGPDCPSGAAPGTMITEF